MIVCPAATASQVDSAILPGGGGTTSAPAPPVQSITGPAKVPGLSDLLSTWQPCGLLSLNEHQVALQICIRLLKYLHAYGKSFKGPGVFMGDQIARPDPAATTQAVLQVMTRLTRCHKRALEVNASQALDSHQMLEYARPLVNQGIGKVCG